MKLARIILFCVASLACTTQAVAQQSAGDANQLLSAWDLSVMAPGEPSHRMRVRGEQEVRFAIRSWRHVRTSGIRVSRFFRRTHPGQSRSKVGSDRQIRGHGHGDLEGRRRIRGNVDGRQQSADTFVARARDACALQWPRMTRSGSTIGGARCHWQKRSW